MDEKKAPTRFTIQFGSDPRSLAVVDLLNGYGRKKAQVIVDAILHYTNCDQTPGERLPDGHHLEQLVRALVSQEMKRQGLCNDTPLRRQSSTPEASPPPSASDQRTTSEGSATDIDPDVAALLSGGLQSFRHGT